MKDSDKIKAVRYLVELQGKIDKSYFQIAHVCASILPKYLYEQLYQLVNGPVYDGDIISKSNRGDLFEAGLAIRCCCKGEQGYTGATYFAYTILTCIEDIKAGKIPG